MILVQGYSVKYYREDDDTCCSVSVLLPGDISVTVYETQTNGALKMCSWNEKDDPHIHLKLLQESLKIQSNQNFGVCLRNFDVIRIIILSIPGSKYQA